MNTSPLPTHIKAFQLALADIQRVKEPDAKVLADVERDIRHAIGALEMLERRARERKPRVNGHG